MNIMVTGGAGYIGSHTVKKLTAKGEKVFVLDNLSRGNFESLPPNITFLNADAGDKNTVTKFISENKIDTVIHFAAYAYVGESTLDPALYYKNNVEQTINLLDAVKECGVKKFVFSSTCSVYGNTDSEIITESEKIDPINPYARTKYILEQVIKDFSNAYGINYVILRYFNAAGADTDGMIGESHEPEPHLIPRVILNSLGRDIELKVFGKDYPTHDGTCIRDYIHVDDLAEAHYLSAKYLSAGGSSQLINLGTGKGSSVLEIIEKVEEVSGAKVSYKVSERRKGDPAVLVASNSKAKKVIGWVPVHDITDIIKSAYKWHKNPKY